MATKLQKTLANLVKAKEANPDLAAKVSFVLAKAKANSVVDSEANPMAAKASFALAKEKAVPKEGASSAEVHIMLKTAPKVEAKVD